MYDLLFDLPPHHPRTTATTVIKQQELLCLTVVSGAQSDVLTPQTVRTWLLVSVGSSGSSVCGKSVMSGSSSVEVSRPYIIMHWRPEVV